MDERMRSFLDLPRWVAAGNDNRAGFIHLAPDGRWRATNWNGSLGAFATAEQAEAAIRAAPKKTKLKRSPKPPPQVGLRFERLTSFEAGYVVLDAGQRQIGAVFAEASGQYAAWDRNGKIGELATLGQAESAVRVAHRARKPRP
jgi:hypothetical protein